MLPLEGLRVLDASRLLPGPYCTLLLADLGADVVKIEDPRGGDSLRFLGPSEGEDSSFFLALNRNKRSLAIDLRHPDGARLVRRLASGFDVLVEGFRPGVMDRLGLGWEALSQANPRLVYCSITGYGPHGPLAGRAGHDLNYLARSGVLGSGGEADGAPAMPGGQLADVGGGLAAAVAILAALQERVRTGLGRRVDVSLLDSALAFLHLPLGGRLAEAGGGAPLARGREPLNGGLPCYRVYRTADGRWLSVAALEPKFWQAFCAAMGRDDLAGSGWASGEEGERVRGEVAAVVAGRTLAEWERFLADRDLCCEPVREGEELLTDEALAPSRFEIFDARQGRAVGQLRTPVRLGDPPARPAPALGEHTGQVLAELGIEGAELEVLLEAGLVAGVSRPH